MITQNSFTVPSSIRSSRTLPALVRSTLTFRKEVGQEFKDYSYPLNTRKGGWEEKVMMGVPIAPGSGDGPTTLNREYSGSLTAGTISAVSPPLTCSAQLTQWEDTDTVPPGESCACPPGATTPQCVSSGNNLAECQAYLASTKADPDEDCTCSSASPTPSCTSYYDLCEAALPGVQTTTNICSCTNPSTTPTPYCITKYQVCENGLAGVQSANPDDVCTCTNPMTVTTPACTPDIDICENQINSYQNNNDVCRCTQSSTKPVCVSKYSICEGHLSSYQTSDNRCTCSQTSTTPSCTSFYDICEANAGQYENSDTTCTCSNNSTQPTCCTSSTVQSCGTTQQCHQMCSTSESSLGTCNLETGNIQYAQQYMYRFDTKPWETTYKTSPFGIKTWYYGGGKCDKNQATGTTKPVSVSNCAVHGSKGAQVVTCDVTAPVKSCHNQCTSHTVCTPVTHKTCSVK